MNRKDIVDGRLGFRVPVVVSGDRLATRVLDIELPEGAGALVLGVNDGTGIRVVGGVFMRDEVRTDRIADLVAEHGLLSGDFGEVIAIPTRHLEYIRLWSARTARRDAQDLQRCPDPACRVLPGQVHRQECAAASLEIFAPAVEARAAELGADLLKAAAAVGDEELDEMQEALILVRKDGTLRPGDLEDLVLEPRGYWLTEKIDGCGARTLRELEFNHPDYHPDTPPGLYVWRGRIVGREELDTGAGFGPTWVDDYTGTFTLASVADLAHFGLCFDATGRGAPEPEEPEEALWRAWLRQLRGEGPQPPLTLRGRAALRALAADLEKWTAWQEPSALFEGILAEVRSSKHQPLSPESLFGTPDRRYQWIDVALRRLNVAGVDNAQREEKTCRD